MKIYVSQIALIWMGTVCGKYRIILSPCYEGRRLMLSEILMPLWIKRRICSVTIEHLELDLVISWTVKQRLVDKPVIRADCFDVSNTMGILPFCCINS